MNAKPLAYLPTIVVIHIPNWSNNNPTGKADVAKTTLAILKHKLNILSASLQSGSLVSKVSSLSEVGLIVERVPLKWVFSQTPSHSCENKCSLWKMTTKFGHPIKVTLKKIHSRYASINELTTLHFLAVQSAIFPLILLI